MNNQIKIRDLIRSITKDLNDYDEKYMKIKFVNKTMKIPIVAIVIRPIFHENKKYYPQDCFR